MEENNKDADHPRGRSNNSLDEVFTSPPPDTHPDHVVAASNQAVPSDMGAPGHMSSEVGYVPVMMRDYANSTKCTSNPRSIRQNNKPSAVLHHGNRSESPHLRQEATLLRRAIQPARNQTEARSIAQPGGSASSVSRHSQALSRSQPVTPVHRVINRINTSGRPSTSTSTVASPPSRTTTLSLVDYSDEDSSDESMTQPAAAVPSTQPTAPHPKSFPLTPCPTPPVDPGPAGMPATKTKVPSSKVKQHNAPEKKRARKPSPAPGNGPTSKKAKPSNATRKGPFLVDSSDEDEPKPAPSKPLEEPRRPAPPKTPASGARAKQMTMSVDQLRNMISARGSKSVTPKEQVDQRGNVASQPSVATEDPSSQRQVVNPDLNQQSRTVGTPSQNANPVVRTPALTKRPSETQHSSKPPSAAANGNGRAPSKKATPHEKAAPIVTSTPNAASRPQPPKVNAGTEAKADTSRETPQSTWSAPVAKMIPDSVATPSQPMGRTNLAGPNSRAGGRPATAKPKGTHQETMGVMQGSQQTSSRVKVAKKVTDQLSFASNSTEEARSRGRPNQQARATESPLEIIIPGEDVRKKTPASQAPESPQGAPMGLDALAKKLSQSSQPSASSQPPTPLQVSQHPLSSQSPRPNPQSSKPAASQKVPASPSQIQNGKDTAAKGRGNYGGFNTNRQPLWGSGGSAKTDMTPNAAPGPKKPKVPARKPEPSQDTVNPAMATSKDPRPKSTGSTLEGDGAQKKKMSVEEAYALLSMDRRMQHHIGNLRSTVDFASQIAPDNKGKYEEAYDLIKKDQEAREKQKKPGAPAQSKPAAAQKNLDRQQFPQLAPKAAPAVPASITPVQPAKVAPKESSKTTGKVDSRPGSNKTAPSSAPKSANPAQTPMKVSGAYFGKTKKATQAPPPDQNAQFPGKTAQAPQNRRNTQVPEKTTQAPQEARHSKMQTPSKHVDTPKPFAAADQETGSNTPAVVPEKSKSHEVPVASTHSTTAKPASVSKASETSEKGQPTEISAPEDDARSETSDTSMRDLFDEPKLPATTLGTEADQVAKSGGSEKGKEAVPAKDDIVQGQLKEHIPRPTQATKEVPKPSEPTKETPAVDEDVTMTDVLDKPTPSIELQSSSQQTTQPSPDDETPATDFSIENAVPLPPVSPSDIPAPHFTYTIHHKHYTSLDDASTIPSIPFSAPSISLSSTNAVATEMYNATAIHESLYGIKYEKRYQRTDDHGCLQCCNIYITGDDLELGLRKYHLIWVAREAVIPTKSAALDEKAMGKEMLRTTLYAVRLCRIVERAITPSSSSSSSSNSGSDSDSDEQPDKREEHHHVDLTPTFLQQHRLSAQIYTTRNLANRAAMQLQVSLSLPKEPKKEMDRVWKAREMKALHDEVLRMEGWKLREEEVEGAADREMDGGTEGKGDKEDERKALWDKKVNGLGGGKWRVWVEKVGVFGPRNV